MTRFINDVKKYFKYSIVSAKSELKSEVASSYLNWLWWILDPVCFMLIYTFISVFVFKATEQYFPVFTFIGLSMWDFFSRMMNNSVKIIKNNKAIVSKVYLPKYILILVKLWVNGFKMFISFGIVVLMMIVYQVPITLNILYFVPIIITLAIISFGGATFLLHYGVFVQDLSNVVTIILRLLFYITGIFYDVAKRIQAPFGEILSEANPLAFLLKSMRESILYGTTPNRKLLLLWMFIGLVITYLGIRKIYKNENSYVKVI